MALDLNSILLGLAVAGVPLLVFGVVALIDLLYQFWVHTQQVGRLGWFDRWFTTPSNHRVHHGKNPAYLDRNYGGWTMIWDRLLGTYAPETEEVVFGITDPPARLGFLGTLLGGYPRLARDMRSAGSVGAAVRIALRRPGQYAAAPQAAATPAPAS